MSAEPSPRNHPVPNAAPRPGQNPNRGDGARARLTVAPDVARRRLRARLIMWGAALVTVASLFTLVAFHVFAAQSAFTMERLSKERTNEQQRYERLRDLNARLSSAETVIAAAKRLGMVPGGTMTPLPVATKHPVSTPPDQGPQTSSAADYSHTKQALAPQP
jgi:hypothetical protein